MNQTYINVWREIDSALSNVTSFELHYPTFIVDDNVVDDYALANLKINIATTNKEDNVSSILRRNCLPWELSLKREEGEQEHTLTVTHIVPHRCHGVIDEFEIWGSRQPKIHLLIHGLAAPLMARGKVTVRDYGTCDIDKIYEETLVTTKDVRGMLWSIFQTFLLEDFFEEDPSETFSLSDNFFEEKSKYHDNSLWFLDELDKEDP